MTAATYEGSSMAKRWRPPPMSETGSQPETGTPKITLDEKVVRKMLQVNPAMRDGRTTFQVKRDMEGGQPVRAHDGPSTRRAPFAAHSVAPPTSGAPKSSGAKGELEETIGFFIKGKAAGFGRELAVIDDQRRALDAEEQEIKAKLQRQMASFISMLDEKVIAMHAVSVLSRHLDFLGQLGLTPAQLLEMARKARTSP